ncbi:MAG TPA: EpsI family protein [Bryobacteraceae bacterium]|jgi:EpsI family protein|nr:EpsI family protein [Bryobacteraceae bacterium]
MRSGGLDLLHNRYLQALTLVLLVQAALFYSASLAEKIPSIPPLTYFPRQVDGWTTAQEIPLEPEIQEVLRADDTLSRVYWNASSKTEAYLFVAYFKTQRAGQAPHSPKNCLPGSGWEPIVSGYASLPVAGEAQPVRINRYVVQHGNDKSVVLYWYQSRHRVVADEFAAKFWLVADSVRYHRSDTSLIRIVIPVRGRSIETATQTGLSFAQSAFPALRTYLGV